MSPQVRRNTKEKSNVVQNSVQNSSQATATSETNPQPKPFFVVWQRSNSTDVSIPMQLEIVEVSSSTQLDLAGHIDTKVNSEDSVTKSSENQKYNKSDKQRETTEQQPQSPIISPFTECNPNRSGDEQKRKNLVKQINILSTNVARKTRRTLLPTNRNDTKPTVLKKLSQIVNCLNENYFQLHFETSKKNNLLAVHSLVRDFSIYMIFVECGLKMANVIKRMSKDGTGDESNNRKLINDIVEQQDINNPSTNTIANVSTKKNPKTQRSDNTRLMLLPETKEDINEKDSGECGWILTSHFGIRFTYNVMQVIQKMNRMKC